MKKITLLTGLILCSFASHAELVKTDWKVEGDRKVVLDTNTGVEWLGARETYNKTYNQVVSELDTTYAGWRVANADELAALFDAYISGFQPDENNQYRYRANDVNSPEYAEIQYVSDNLNRGYHQHRGLYLDDGALKMAFGYVINNNYAEITYGDNAAHYDDYAYSSSVYLVSDGGVSYTSINNPGINANNPNSPAAASVSVPAGFAAFGLALLALGVRRKRSAI